MKDVLHQNYPTLTGSPTLIAGPLTDLTQALRLTATDTWTVADSASSSLTIADAAAGGAAMSGWFSLPSLPGATQTILGKVGSYELKVTSAGKLQWIITNGANNVTVTSAATISIGTWYHFAGVYNGDYTGATVFGYQTQGASQLNMPGDYFQGSPTSANNLQASRTTALEKGTATSIVVDLQRVHDATLNEIVRFGLFGPNTTTAAGALLGMTDEVTLSSSARAWVTVPITASFYAGDVWPAFIAGESSNQFKLGYETTGANRAYRNAAYASGFPDPFGTAAGTDNAKFSMYVNYTATGRTGAEGKALIYLNGLEDASTAYAHGIADTANALTHPAGVAVDLKSWAIWNRKLSPVEVATQYAAR